MHLLVLSFQFHKDSVILFKLAKTTLADTTKENLWEPIKEYVDSL